MYTKGPSVPNSASPIEALCSGGGYHGREEQAVSTRAALSMSGGQCTKDDYSCEPRAASFETDLAYGQVLLFRGSWFEARSSKTTKAAEGRSPRPPSVGRMPEG